MQKRITDNPLGTLPVQYLAGLVLCSVFVPFQPFHFEHTASFYLPVLWMGLVVSLLATLLLYRLIARGNLVSFFLSSQAATDESTPPLIATKTFSPICCSMLP